MGFHHSKSPRVFAEGGPVTRAIRTMRAAEPVLEPEHPALAALRQGVEDYFADAGMMVDLDAQMCVELARVREIREAIANRIEADLALLDAIDGCPDLEDGADAELSLCGTGFGWPSPEDREAGDDNGIADALGEAEQVSRFARVSRQIRQEEARHG